jgi:hypothetical protein
MQRTVLAPIEGPVNPAAYSRACVSNNLRNAVVFTHAYLHADGARRACASGSAPWIYHTDPGQRQQAPFPFYVTPNGRFWISATSYDHGANGMRHMWIMAGNTMLSQPNYILNYFSRSGDAMIFADAAVSAYASSAAILAVGSKPQIVVCYMVNNGSPMTWPFEGTNMQRGSIVISEQGRFSLVAETSTRAYWYAKAGGTNVVTALVNRTGLPHAERRRFQAYADEVLYAVAPIANAQLQLITTTNHLQTLPIYFGEAPTGLSAARSPLGYDLIAVSFANRLLVLRHNVNNPFGNPFLLPVQNYVMGTLTNDGRHLFARSVALPDVTTAMPLPAVGLNWNPYWMTPWAGQRFLHGAENHTQHPKI